MTPLPFHPDTAQNQELRRAPSSLFGPVRRASRRRFGVRVSAVLTVSAGGVLGGCARYGIDQLMPTEDGAFPWGTFLVNVIGSFWLALLLVLILEVWPPTRHLRPFLAVGLLGSFTTFSTWMLEVNVLVADGAPALAASYLAASMFAGVAATSLGLVIGRGAVTRHTSTAKKGR